MKIHRKDLCLITTFIFAVLLSGCSRRENSQIGAIFKIPPDVLTKSGNDPLQGQSGLPPMADIFWSNTISEQGYAQNSNFQLDPPAGFVQFFRTVTRLSVGANYRPRYWILRPNQGGFLKWTEEALLSPENRAFWITSGKFENQEVGPLTMIYDGNLIDRQNLTIVVTDLEEQGLNMGLLADIIRNKLLTTDDYAAAVIALKLPFNGLNYKPDPNRINNMVETRHRGLKPIYAVVSGPREAVSLFIRRFSEQSKQFNTDDLHIVTTTQKGQIPSLAVSDVIIPQPAIRSDFAKVERNNKRIMSDLWNIRTGRNNYDGFPDRIWNLQNMTDSMVDHFKLVVDGNKLSPITELLDVLLLQYKWTTRNTKNGQALWQLNIHFNIPQGCDVSELEAQIRNYRYLTLLDPPNDKTDTAKKKQKKQQNDDIDPVLLQEWQPSNNAFIARDFEIGKPDLVPGTNTAQIYVAPKDMKRGALESRVICFDLIVRVKKEIEIPLWVNDFDDPTNRTQEKTWNFGIFINNLLKGESATGVVYSDDELLRIPIVLFDIPAVGQNKNKRR